ncbi:MAG: DNA polymerase III subunit epsilon [Candidatus Paracaedimonas acanthamoebae]|uniref:DNA polymerase III subunit epsilon n=1 Tax=Candidatus Paracaedimonas acanthamoebae TaxID=244581 RepID=A0A8J7PGP2_9PROT|nr:DNA polymerase III subunit epsilon [Candidatus Paracaedimonas acanthamoebae]
MREIVLDTETTGFEPSDGHRLVEIGCIELINFVPTGAVFHKYINPEREVPQEAFNVHGLSYSFLKDHPLFEDIHLQFLEFIGDSPLVIHNARFDMKFLNAELGRLNSVVLPSERAIDTLALAKSLFPGSPASLDALCRRFEIDNSNRIKHGALLDAELLAEVYLELKGGRQPTLNLATKITNSSLTAAEKKFYPARPFEVHEADLQLHEVFLDKLKNPAWRSLGNHTDSGKAQGNR